MTIAALGATLVTLSKAWEKYSNHKEMIKAFLKLQNGKTLELIRDA